MLISLNWLKKYISLEYPADKIAETLTSLGIEVDDIQRQCADVTKVICAEVVACEPHPDADSLSVCQVSDGEKTLQVVCGAPNVAIGQKVLFAQVGALLKENFKIKKSKIRGVPSLGMICAEDEIGLGDNHDGIIVLPPETPIGTSLQNIPGLCDTILELSVTPNRPDALCYIGVARELAAYYKTNYTAPKGPSARTSDVSSNVSIKVEAPEDCSLYTGIVIKNAKVGPSPDWLISALSSVGLNSVNNVVDATNYVLFETGHPSHAFDLNKIKDHQLIIRKGIKGETLVTLDKEKRAIDERDLVIADPSGPICLAGVMGGESTKVDDTTTDILLEVAYFHPPTVRQQAKRHTLSSDSSFRFERGVNPLGVEKISDYLSRLLAQLTGGVITGSCITERADNHLIAEKKIKLRYSRLKKILGVDIPPATVLSLLNSIEIHTISEDKENGAAILAAPGFRPDLEREVDLIEEVARLFNFNNIPAKLPSFKLSPVSLPPAEKMARAARYHLVSQGLNDCLSLRFTSPKYIQWLTPDHTKGGEETVPLLNPLSEEWQVMPTTPLIALLRAARYNQNNQEKNCALFEIGKAFIHQPEKRDDNHPGVKEEDRLAIVICGEWKDRGWNAESVFIDYFQIKGLVENVFSVLDRQPAFSEVQPESYETACLHPAESAVIQVDQKIIGKVGMLHPRVQSDFGIKGNCAVAEINLTKLLKTKAKKLKFQPFGHFSSTTREMNIVVDESITYEQIVSWMPLKTTKNLANVKLNSIYQGKGLESGKKAMHFSFVYRNDKKTLTDKEVNKAQDRLASELEKRSEISFK